MLFAWQRKFLWLCLPNRELSWLRRRLPNAHRLWVRTGRGIRHETNAEYLLKLRQLALQRAPRFQSC